MDKFTALTRVAPSSPPPPQAQGPVLREDAFPPVERDQDGLIVSKEGAKRIEAKQGACEPGEKRPRHGGPKPPAPEEGQEPQPIRRRPMGPPPEPGQHQHPRMGRKPPGFGEGPEPGVGRHRPMGPPPELGEGQPPPRMGRRPMGPPPEMLDGSEPWAPPPGARRMPPPPPPGFDEPEGFDEDEFDGPEGFGVPDDMGDDE